MAGAGSLVWLPMLLALFVPSVFSYLINRFSSAALWTGLLLTAVLCVWMNYWYLSEATAGHTRELSSLIPLMVLLFWLILPWFQLRQLSGSWNPDYALLTEQYVRNTVLGALAGLIGLLVMGMLFLAVYLFRIVNLEFLSDWLNDSLYFWMSFCLGFNISLVFIRTVFTFSTGKIAGYVARVLLPLLTVIGVIAAGGLLLSVVTGVRVSGLGSFTMIWFVSLNILLLNLVYGNECVPRFRSWLNGLVLAGVLLLNVFRCYRFTAFWCVLISTAGVSIGYTDFVSHCSWRWSCWRTAWHCYGNAADGPYCSGRSTKPDY